MQANRYGVNSLSFGGSLLWNTLKGELERTGTLAKLKKLTTKLDSKACNCLHKTSRPSHLWSLDILLSRENCGAMGYTIFYQ